MSDMDVHEMTDRISGHLDDLRDKAADALGAETSPGYRELARNRRALEHLTKRLDDRLDKLDTSTQGRIDDLTDAIDGGGSWFGRLFWMLVGGAIGYGVAYLADPVEGRGRRAQLSDQMGAQTRDVKDTAVAKADYAAGVAKGAAAEAIQDKLGDDQDIDPNTLRQKIQSEVIGQVDGADAVVVTIHDAGRVSLKGRVATATAKTTLVERTRAVTGVTSVDAELTVGS